MAVLQESASPASAHPWRDEYTNYSTVSFRSKVPFLPSGILWKYLVVGRRTLSACIWISKDYKLQCLLNCQNHN